MISVYKKTSLYQITNFV